jgi:hypothetical protein
MSSSNRRKTVQAPVPATLRQPDEQFSNVFSRSEYTTTDPLIKLNYTERGNHIVFGRSPKDQDMQDLIYLGKVVENTPGKNYLNANCWLDVRFPHVVYITGTRGSGKSFDLGVLIEGLSDLTHSSIIQAQVKPTASILIDTQSQFWTLGYPPNPNIPQNKRQLDDLQRWRLRPNSLKNCRLFLPTTSESVTGTESRFSIRPSQVKHEEWCALFGEEVYSPQGHVLSETIEAMQTPDFSIDDLNRYIANDRNWNVPTLAASRATLQYKLEDYARTGLFGNAGIDVGELLVAGQCNVFMLRDLRNIDKSLVTGLIARQLFTRMGEYHKRLKVSTFFDREMKGPVLPDRVWLLIDEAHVIAPADVKAPARAALVEYVKRGRDSGLSLALATQQPSAVDDGILSQNNITFSHRLTFQSDISATSNRIPTKQISEIKLSGVKVREFGDMLRYLDTGQCLLGDHNTSRVVLIHVRPRLTSHGGYSPS